MKDYLIEVIHKFVPINGSDIPVGDNVESSVDAILARPNTICIAEEGKGIILGLVYPAYWNTSVLIAQELGWWVEPEYRGTSVGIKLYSKFKQRARELGATKLMMICLESSEPDKLESFYLLQGLKPTERTFMGDL